jgi:CDGSH-type Zn-finger protein/truncated hemoglobin YjbI
MTNADETVVTPTEGQALLARIDDLVGRVPEEDPNTAADELHHLFSRAVYLARALLDPASNEVPEGLLVGRRLVESVLLPLVATFGAAEPNGSRRLAPKSDQLMTSAAPAGERWTDHLSDLTKAATELRARSGASTGLIEAVAALQGLALQFHADSGSLLAELADLQAGLAAGIQVSLNGPYLVTNAEGLNSYFGLPIPSAPQMALCRCGESASKPFCDGSHAASGFSGAKDAKRVEDRRDTYIGQQVTILDNRGICAHSGFCTDRLAAVFHVDAEPFVTPSGGRMDEIIRAVRACPSGALSLTLDGQEIRDHVDLPRPPAIEVSKDGPYRVTGGIPLVDAGGNSESRVAGASSEHYSLCRCGHSLNKPFCSGMHWYVDFHDPVIDVDQEPTVFEWCGGLPALTRMTKIFYEKYVPQDPLLAPLFAAMSPDHPERVAAWLGEVFGGPKAYSEMYGGYSRMISQHLGKEITEDKRARWVELLQQSALDAGLPNDPEFRSVFASYIGWGSRLAVENSQIGARPPEHMPMPHWEWNTAAGPPGSRVSALVPAVDDPPVVLPAADEPLSFDAHIKSFFRQHDRQSMKFAFDLWSCTDVRLHSTEILERLRSGSMPCDGGWPPEQVQAFQRWIESGMAG